MIIASAYKASYQRSFTWFSSKDYYATVFPACGPSVDLSSPEEKNRFGLIDESPKMELKCPHGLHLSKASANSLGSDLKILLFSLTETVRTEEEYKMKTSETVYYRSRNVLVWEDL